MWVCRTVVLSLFFASGCTKDVRVEGFDIGSSGGGPVTPPDPSSSPSGSSTAVAANDSTSTGDARGQSSSSSSSGGGSTGVPMDCGDGAIDPGDVCLTLDPTVLPMGVNVRDISIADFNLDGALDIATLDVETPMVFVRYGDGNRGFDDSLSWDVTPGAFRLAHADWDIDGDPDMVVLGQNLTMFYNNAGTFELGPGTSSGIITDDLTDGIVGNFDVHLGLDLVHNSLTHGYYQRGTLGANGWEFGLSYLVPVSTSGATGIAKAAFAFDDDDIEDLIMLARDERYAKVLVANGGGGFQQHGEVEVCPIGSGAYRVAIGELNGDGDQDLVVTCTAGIWTILFGAGDGTFGSPIQQVLDTAFRPLIVDIDHDGDNDVLITAAGFGQVAIYINDSTGTVVFRDMLQVGGDAWTVVVEDLDGDDAVDVAVAVSDQATDQGNVSVFWADP